MQRLRSRLPPVNALVVFEACVRHLSFTRAASELGVTREAVSRQIRRLEDHLGRPLFVRRHRALSLTMAGRTFGVRVHAALEDIARAAQTIAERTDKRVTVTATIAIASYWLTPRLPTFRQKHPGAEIRVVVSDGPPDMAEAGIDVGLRYGDGDWPGLDSVRLFAVESGPVCAPRYLAREGPIAGVEDLCRHTLLNLDGGLHAEEDWQWWLREVGLANEMSDLDVVGFDNYTNVIQAAVDGQGIALGFSRIVDNLLDEGHLVWVVERRLDPGHSVFLVSPRGARQSSCARDFHDWVCGEVAQDEARSHATQDLVTNRPGGKRRGGRS